MIDEGPLRTLAASQHSLVTVGQARGLNYGYGQIERLADGRRWERVTHCVLRLVGSTDSVEQRAMASVLDAGAGAALGGRSAAAWWGIPGNKMEPFEIVRIRDRSHTPAKDDR